MLKKLTHQVRPNQSVLQGSRFGWEYETERIGLVEVQKTDENQSHLRYVSYLYRLGSMYFDIDNDIM